MTIEIKDICPCCRSSRQVFIDLLSALNRLPTHAILDDHVIQHLKGMKSGLFIANERFEITTAALCKQNKEQENETKN